MCWHPTVIGMSSNCVYDSSSLFYNYSLTFRKSKKIVSATIVVTSVKMPQKPIKFR